MGDWSKNGDFYRRNTVSKTIAFHKESDKDILEWIEALPRRSLMNEIRMALREHIRKQGR